MIIYYMLKTVLGMGKNFVESLWFFSRSGYLPFGPSEVVLVFKLLLMLHLKEKFDGINKPWP